MGQLEELAFKTLVPWKPESHAQVAHIRKRELIPENCLMTSRNMLWKVIDFPLVVMIVEATLVETFMEY